MAQDDAALIHELVGFLHDLNPEVRAVAVNRLLSHTTVRDPLHLIFKRSDLRAVKDLKLLVLDRPRTAHDALKSLINLSQDAEIRAALADALFLDSLLSIISNPSHGLADLACMLLANVAKDDAIERLVHLTRKPATGAVTSSDRALDQLMDCFVRGAERKLNPHATFDFLANVFADLTRFDIAREYLLQRQSYDGVVPISKLVVFTKCPSQIRRTGVAAIIKNCCFEVSCHAQLLDESDINVLSFLLLPLCGGDEYDAEETEQMLPELQLLPEDQKREPDTFTQTVLLDALLLLGSTREGREHMRRRQVYPIVRQLHAANTDGEVAEASDKLVNVLMRGEEGDLQAEDAMRCTVLDAENARNAMEEY